MYAELIEYLDTAGLTYQKLPERMTVRFGISLDNGHYECYADALEESSQFIVCSISPVKVPLNKRALVAEFLTRINYRLLLGGFEMDYADGEVRFKTTLIYEDDIPPTDALIDRTFKTNLRMMDRFFPGIMAIVYGNASPEDMAHQTLEEPNPGRN
jgi:hypothetical protein